jgi:dihydrofolate synthase / folylpolyglutamate synthase
LKYSETLDYLYSRLPMFQRTGPAAYKDSLDNIRSLDDYYGNPHRRFKTVHVAGTNGKGSLSHMLASILQMAGYKTGLYTSPHLKDFRERIKINGRMISRSMVNRWVKRFMEAGELEEISPSFFELTVALAFDYFAGNNVDIAVIEVGLGGRLDSTNIITPEVSVITNIGLDHTYLLGNSLKSIAVEKAGIIKPGVPVVIGTFQSGTEKVYKKISGSNQAPLYFADRIYKVTYSRVGINDNQVFFVEDKSSDRHFDIEVDLGGRYQQKNLPAVLKVIDILKEKGWNITGKNVVEGLAHAKELTGLRGRWELLGKDPLIIADTGHNAEGISEVIKQIGQMSYENLHIVFGMVSDKDPMQILRLLPREACYYFTKAGIPRALDENVLANYAIVAGLKGKPYASVREAFSSAIANAGKNDLIFVGGSTFIVAEVL